jgi:hypothetical protein
MVIDPEFTDIGEAKSKSQTPWRRVRWLLVYPFLRLAGCRMLMTGSPIPLWYSESLNHPAVVKELTDKTLVLADSRIVCSWIPPGQPHHKGP